MFSHTGGMGIGYRDRGYGHGGRGGTQLRIGIILSLKK